MATKEFRRILLDGNPVDVVVEGDELVAGDGRRVAIASLLLGEGHFHDKLIASGADVVTAPLGTATQVVEQILTRFDGVG